jgi:hypothetical protein
MPDDARSGRRGGLAFGFGVVVALVLVIAAPLALHVSQQRHDRLPFDVNTEFPPERPVPPGTVFASTLIALMDHELTSATGWRPNDFFLWSPDLWADNNSNRQLGIILAVRESVRVFKDHLTKVSATEYDQNLVDADTAFRNDARRLWLPSAESRYRAGVAALRHYVEGLQTNPPTSKPLTRRNIELIRLYQAWSDLLGDAHANLFKDRESDGSTVSVTHTDDYFYHAQGVAHVIHHLGLAVRREYAIDFTNRPTLDTLVAQAGDALGAAAVMKPFIVLDGGAAGLLANHRRNLDAYIVDARQRMYSIREELEK